MEPRRMQLNVTGVQRSRFHYEPANDVHGLHDHHHGGLGAEDR